MNGSRKAIRGDNEITLQYRSPQVALLEEELNEDQLTQLRELIGGLERTPPGAAELQRRVKLFGECKQIDGETLGQFYGKLHYWLDKEMPPTKSAIHAPSQTGD
jgi:hypothetical protein